MDEVQDHLFFCLLLFFLCCRLNIASADHCLGLTKVTEKLQLWQEMDIICEGQNQSTLILLSSINVSVKAVLSHYCLCERKGLAHDLNLF